MTYACALSLGLVLSKVVHLWIACESHPTLSDPPPPPPKKKPKTQTSNNNYFEKEYKHLDIAENIITDANYTSVFN